MNLIKHDNIYLKVFEQLIYLIDNFKQVTKFSVLNGVHFRF